MPTGITNTTLTNGAATGGNSLVATFQAAVSQALMGGNAGHGGDGHAHGGGGMTGGTGMVGTYPTAGYPTAGYAGAYPTTGYPTMGYPGAGYGYPGMGYGYPTMATGMPGTPLGGYPAGLPATYPGVGGYGSPLAANYTVPMTGMPMGGSPMMGGSAAPVYSVPPLSVYDPMGMGAMGMPMAPGAAGVAQIDGGMGMNGGMGMTGTGAGMDMTGMGMGGMGMTGMGMGGHADMHNTFGNAVHTDLNTFGGVHMNHAINPDMAEENLVGYTQQMMANAGVQFIPQGGGTLAEGATVTTDANGDVTIQTYIDGPAISVAQARRNTDNGNSQEVSAELTNINSVSDIDADIYEEAGYTVETDENGDVTSAIAPDGTVVTDDSLHQVNGLGTAPVVVDASTNLNIEGFHTMTVVNTEEVDVNGDGILDKITNFTSDNNTDENAEDRVNNDDVNAHDGMNGGTVVQLGDGTGEFTEIQTDTGADSYLLAPQGGTGIAGSAHGAGGHGGAGMAGMTMPGMAGMTMPGMSADGHAHGAPGMGAMGGMGTAGLVPGIGLGAAGAPMIDGGHGADGHAHGAAGMGGAGAGMGGMGMGGVGMTMPAAGMVAQPYGAMPGYGTPGYGMTPGYGTPGYGSPYGVTPTYSAPAPAYVYIPVAVTPAPAYAAMGLGTMTPGVGTYNSAPPYAYLAPASTPVMYTPPTASAYAMPASSLALPMY